jgi:hypothetical protein
MKRLQYIFVIFVLMRAALAWSQTSDPSQQQPVHPSQQEPVDPSQQEPATNVVDHPEDRMQTPPPVTGATFPAAFAAEERSNLLEYGVAFMTAYSDNVLAGLEGHPVSDISYSIAPTIAIDATTPRLRWIGSYAPGFTFYQHTSNLNESDHNATLDFQYRLSPHVTVSARDGFVRSSNVLNQPDFGGGTVSGGTAVPNFSVIPPVADRLSNSGNVDLTYQFALNGMIGASGTFTNLHYPNPSQVPGLSDSNTQAGAAFYSLRLSRMHYIGVTYQYQRLRSYPAEGGNETQTHAPLLFYTLYPTPHSSISVFGGPQYSDTVQPVVAPSNMVSEARTWTPAAGGSLGWQGHVTSFAVSYSHMVAGGGGLVGAVHMDSASSSIRRQIAKTLNGSLNASYTQNKVIGDFLGGASDGHSVSGTAEIEKLVGPNLRFRLGYTRLHQTYTGVSAIAVNPDTNREFISISYHFSRPLGR